MSKCIYCGKEIEGESKQVYPGKVPGAVPIKDTGGNYTGKWESKGEFSIPLAHLDCPKGVAK